VGGERAGNRETQKVTQDTSARHIGKTHRGESDGARGQILHLGWGEISGLKVVTLRLYGFLMPSDLAALSGC
jgi:hypothetical protein